MLMTTRVRKAALTVHIVSSVGLLGAVATFLLLAVVGLGIRDSQLARAPYIAMGLIAWSIILPAAFATLITGIIQSLGTRWGLLRHKWVLAKLLVTAFATSILIIKMALITAVAEFAKLRVMAVADIRMERIELVFHAAAGLVVLLVPMVLSVFKPWGMTRMGIRKKSHMDHPATPVAQ